MNKCLRRMEIRSGLAAFAVILGCATSGRGDPAPSPAVPGWVVAEICRANSSRPKSATVPDWIMIDPSQIAIIANPADSPNGCVKITNPAGRGIWVVGSEASIALARNAAMAQRMTGSSAP